MKRHLPSFLCLSLLCLSVTVSAQNLELSTCGGTVGQNIQIEVRNGQANGLLLRVLSFHRAYIPLALFDPGDPRVLRVGLDSTYISFLDATGSYSTVLPLPNYPGLAGLTIAQQAATAPGATTIVDELSDVVATPLGIGGVFAAQTATLATPRSFATTIPLADDRVLVVGGGTGLLLFQNASNTTDIWDPVSRTLTPGPTMVSPRSAHTQTLLQDGRYLLVGGVNATNNTQNSCEIFDPQTGLFTAAASMTAVRAHHTATLLSDGRVLVAGGIQNMLDATSAVTSSTSSTTIYNPASNTWAPGPTLSRPRGAHMGVHLGNGKVLLCGGISWSTFFFQRVPNLQARCDLFDEATNTMTAGPLMTTKRALAGAFLLPNGRALMIGGITGNIQAGGVPTNLCESYNPNTNSWSASPARAVPLAFPRCLTLADGTLVSIGGADGNLFAPLPIATCETIDPVTGVWSTFPTLSTARAAPAVGPLPSCGVAVFGGSTTTAAVSSDTIELLVR